MTSKKAPENQTKADPVTEQIQKLYEAVAIPEPILQQVRLGKMFASDDYKIFMKDCRKCLERWQYYEPASYPVEERYELDKEAYIQTFFNPELKYRRSIEYDERILLERLIKNLKPAKHPYFITYRNILGGVLEDVSALKPYILKSNTEVLTESLTEYGFYELDKVKVLSLAGKKKLMSDLAAQSLPYQIAMLDYLGFLEYLQTHHAKTKGELQKILSKVLLVNTRSVKGNIYVLSPKSNENRTAYTAHLHTEQVKKDYKNYK